MKTISLDELAYSRSKSWRCIPSESFSSVVKRVLPEPGTLGTLLNFVETHHTRSLQSNVLLEETVDYRFSAKQDSWI
jgi:hypothetical protein